MVLFNITKNADTVSNHLPSPPFHKASLDVTEMGLVAYFSIQFDMTKPKSNFKKHQMYCTRDSVKWQAYWQIVRNNVLYVIERSIARGKYLRTEYSKYSEALSRRLALLNNKAYLGLKKALSRKNVTRIK